MTESNSIASAREPLTVERLVASFRAGGLRNGDALLVHTSLRALGWICGGPAAVIEALQQVLTPAGLLVMPTFTGDNSDPAQWVAPPVPEPWWETIRTATPPFDPARTPTRGMGRVPELFRTWPDVVRSDHPASSFAAWGSGAAELVASHALDYPHGPDSPLGRLSERGGQVLLLGVGHQNNTTLHLAEELVPDAPREKLHASVVIGGERVWCEYVDVAIDAEPFPEIGRAYELEHPDAITRFPVGAGTAMRMAQAPLVEFGVRWLQERRRASG
ncbi:MAG: AAC(3) family N-acetyltransferase [Planctomycetota bacterium]